jgi:hypothetical protein
MRMTRNYAPVPYIPYSTEQHTARFAVAMAEVFDQESIALGVGVRPGQCAKNVFDWPDGLRLILGRRRNLKGELITSVSASATAGYELWRKMEALMGTSPSEGLILICDIVHKRFAEISGGLALCEHFVVLQGILHFHTTETHPEGMA